MPTFVEYWKRAQDWVSDVRSRHGTWSQTVVARLKEMGLEQATIGMDGVAGPLDPDGWVPYSIIELLKASLPTVRFVELGDLLETTRSIKSDEEIAMLEKASALGDKMLQACRTARVQACANPKSMAI